MDTPKISILSHTYQSFVDELFAILGKGRLHIGLAYEEWFRKGHITGENPAFQNAQEILKNILSLTEMTLPQLSLERTDGTTNKFLLKTKEGLEIESVLIPMHSGGTLCVSSQVGCKMGCSFCETGKMGLLRNLSVEEIVSQVFIARHVLGLEVRNVVFMGMGEPFDNYDAVIQAFKVLIDPHGLAFGRQRITVSTSGCIDGIEKLIQEGPHTPNLAVSINAPNDLIRSKLMPINNKHNMQALYNAMHSYCEQTGRQILAAYVLLKDVNDSLTHADELAAYLRGLNVKVNLIPYNPQSRDRYQPPDLESLEAFTKRIREHGYYTLLRVTKGQEIMAACGQLGNLELRKLRALKRP